MAMRQTIPTVSIGAPASITGNRDKANRWTVPIGTAISTIMKIGKLPVRIGAEVHYSMLHPDDLVGSRWNFRLFSIACCSFGTVWLDELARMEGWMK